MILCGLDEVGRGPLAGPLIAAAVILPEGFDFAARFPGLRFGDSKKLSPRQRQAAYDLIRVHALSMTIQRIDVPEIDANGIGWANRIIFERLISAVEADQYVVDGNLKFNLPESRRALVRSVVRADQTEAAVSAASIVAKVTRDRLMDTLHAMYPAYGWDTNRGYGTRSHVRALHQHGLTVQHRRQFAATALAHRTLSLWK